MGNLINIEMTESEIDEFIQEMAKKTLTLKEQLIQIETELDRIDTLVKEIQYQKLQKEIIESYEEEEIKPKMIRPKAIYSNK